MPPLKLLKPADHKKNYDMICKKIDPVTKDVTGMLSAEQSNRNMINEAAIECGRLAQVLKDEGNTGTRLKDFIKDPGFKIVLKSVDTFIADRKKMDAKHKKAVNDAKSCQEIYQNLVSALEKELVQRKADCKKLKSNDPKVKEMAEVEAILKKVKVSLRDLNNDVILELNSLEFESAKTKQKFQKDADAEIGRAKASRDGQDRAEMDGMKTDPRWIAKTIPKIKKQGKSIDDAFESLKKIGKSAKSEKKAVLVKAVDDFKKFEDDAKKAKAEVEALIKPIEDFLGRMNPNQLKMLEKDPDGKKLIKAKAEADAVYEKIKQAAKETPAIYETLRKAKMNAEMRDDD